MVVDRVEAIVAALRRPESIADLTAAERWSILASLSDLDDVAIADLWAEVRRRFGVVAETGHPHDADADLGGALPGPDPVAELTYGLGREHFRAWPRECRATMGMIPEVDRVVRVIELTTAGFVCAVSAENAWHAYLMADGLPEEAFTYLREYSGGEHWRELVRHTPAEALTREAVHAPPASPQLERWLALVASARGHNVRAEVDRARGLGAITADRLELGPVVIDGGELGGVAVRAQRVEVRGVVIDALVATEREPGQDNVLLVSFETLVAHDVHVTTSLGELVVERLDARSLALSLSEIARGPAGQRPAALALQAHGGEVSDDERWTELAAELVRMLVEPMAGPIGCGPGGGELVAGGLALRGVSWPERGWKASVLELGQSQLRLERVPSGAKDARAADVATFMELYTRQRGEALDLVELDRFFALLATMEGAVSADVAAMRVVGLERRDPGGPVGDLRLDRIDIGRTQFAARSGALGCTHVSGPSAVMESLLTSAPRPARAAPRDAEIEVSLAKVDVAQAALERATARVVIAPLTASDVRLAGRIPRAAPTQRSTLGAWLTRVGVEQVKADVDVTVTGRATGRAALMSSGLRVDLPETGDVRVTLADLSSPGITLRSTDPARRDWRHTIPTLDLRRLAGLTLDATIHGASRTASVTVGFGQAQIATWSYPGIASSPELLAGLVLGQTTARGLVVLGPWRARLDELKTARIEARGLRNAWVTAAFGVDVGRGFCDDVRVKGLDFPAGQTGKPASLHLGRVGFPELEVVAGSDATMPRAHGKPTLMASAVEVGRTADGRVTLQSGPVVMAGVIGLGEGLFAARGTASIDGLRGGRARDRMVSLEATGAALELHVERAHGESRAVLDARASLRGPSLVGQLDGVLGLRFDGSDLSLGGKVEHGAAYVGGAAEARGVTARMDVVAPVAGDAGGRHLIVRSAALPKLQVKDLVARWSGGELTSPAASCERIDVHELDVARAAAGVVVAGGTARAAGLLVERAQAKLGDGLAVTATSWRGSGIEASLAPSVRGVACADVQGSALAMVTRTGRIELPSLRLSEVAFGGADATWRARSASFVVADSTAQGAQAGATTAGSPRVELDFLHNMRGEIGLTVPIGHDRITGQLIVDPSGVEIAPTLVASHALAEQYWGWAPRWLVSRLVVSAARYVADFFDAELVRMRVRLAERIAGRADVSSATKVASEIIAGQLVDTMVRWSAAVDVLTPAERGGLRTVGDPIDRWLGSRTDDDRGADPARERRMQDIRRWADGIGLVVGIQATGEARIDSDRAVGEPLASARVGARLAGAGTLGSGLALAFTGNLSHIAFRTAGIALSADAASLDETASTRGQVERGVTCVATGLTLRPLG